VRVSRAALGTSLVCALCAPAIAKADDRPAWNVQSCAAFYARDVWLSRGALTIRFTGRAGVSAYSYTIDDAPAVAIPFIDPAAEQSASVSIEGEAFDRLRRARRLTLQATTVTSTLPIADVDLSGMPDALRRLSAAACAE
jgi:hypothetical protein